MTDRTSRLRRYLVRGLLHFLGFTTLFTCLYYFGPYSSGDLLHELRRAALLGLIVTPPMELFDAWRETRRARAR